MFRRKKSSTDTSERTSPSLSTGATDKQQTSGPQDRGSPSEARLDPAAPVSDAVTTRKPDEESRMQPSKPSSSGFVPEIPRRTLDLPGSSSRRGGAPRSESKKLTVGPEISLTGEITACDSLVVEGTVDATLENSRQLEVTESGHFKGKVVIDDAIIGGRFEGTLVVRQTLQIRSTGRVVGSVRFGQLEVELGGQIDGDISIFKDEPVNTPE